MAFDRYPLFLQTLVQVLDEKSIDVRGQTTSARHALALLDEHEPDLFVAGVDAADSGTGIELVRTATSRLPSLKVIALSNGSDGGHVEEAFAAGASAYVTNNASPEDISVAIRQMFDHSIHLAAERRAPVSSPRAADAAGLTGREQEILKLVAEGHSNAELAKILWVTPQTVKFHLSNVYRKLNVSNRTQASRWALLTDLVQERGSQSLAEAK